MPGPLSDAPWSEGAASRDQPGVVAAAGRAHRAGGLLGADEHAVGCAGGLEPRGDQHMGVGVRLSEELAFAHQRHVRGVDDLERRQDTFVGNHPAWSAMLDRVRARAFEYLPAAAAHGLRQPEQVFARIELRLLVEVTRPPGSGPV